MHTKQKFHFCLKNEIVDPRGRDIKIERERSKLKP